MSRVTSTSVALEGVTDQDSVLINGRRIATPSGVLRAEYPLDLGDNLLDVSAANGAGTTTVRLVVTRE